MKIIKKKKFTHEDIPISECPPLDEIRKGMKLEGYSDKDIESIITGLSTLPEYKNEKTRQTADKKAKKLNREDRGI